MSFWVTITDAIVVAFDFVDDTGSDIGDFFEFGWEAFEESWNDALALQEDLWSGVYEDVSDAWDDVEDGASDAWDDTVDALQDFSSVIDSALDWF